MLSVKCPVVRAVRLQVESYIHTLYSENAALSDVPPNAPVQGYHSSLSHMISYFITAQL